MATVYLALDPRFQREVAVKVLPKAYLNDPLFRARFEREAQTIASLEHPAIVPVHDFGDEEGRLYLVMAYMPGGSLADRLQEGAMSPQAAARVLRRIGAALDQAHRVGIVHRDLKPANILFDRYDNAYLSDFGIVKLAQATSNLTGEAVIGTPSYMSPEQARGDDELDGRSDIYAMGAILYTMLCGAVPYEAETPVGVLVKHISAPLPRLTEHKPDLGPYDAVIQKAMAKSPQARYATADELVIDLDRVIGGQVARAEAEAAAQSARQPAHLPAAAAHQEQATRLSRRPAPWMLALGALFIVACVAGIALGASALPAVLGDDSETGRQVTATEGAAVAQESPVTATATLRLTATPTSTPADAATPTPSAFVEHEIQAGESLVGIALAYGVSVDAIIESNQLSNGDSLRVGQVLLIPVDPARADLLNTAPQATVTSTSTTQPAASATPQLRNGPIVFDSANDIYVMNADGTGLQQLTDSPARDDEADVSSDGRFIAFETDGGGDRVIMLMGINGQSPRELVAGRLPDWSPDDRFIAFEAGFPQQIHVVEVSTGEVRQITNTLNHSRAPSWSPDGEEIAFMTEVGRNWQLAVVDVDTGQHELITSGSPSKRFPVWSPDGDLIAYNTLTSSGGIDHIWVVEPSGDNARRLTSEGQNGRPAWSPDGQYILFNSNRTGNWLIYRMDRNGSNQTVLTGAAGDAQRANWGPAWR